MGKEHINIIIFNDYKMGFAILYNCILFAITPEVARGLQSGRNFGRGQNPSHYAVNSSLVRV